MQEVITMEKKMISVRLDPYVISVLDALSDELGISKTEVITASIRFLKTFGRHHSRITSGTEECSDAIWQLVGSFEYLTKQDE